MSIARMDLREFLADRSTARSETASGSEVAAVPDAAPPHPHATGDGPGVPLFVDLGSGLDGTSVAGRPADGPLELVTLRKGVTREGGWRPDAFGPAHLYQSVPSSGSDLAAVSRSPLAPTGRPRLLVAAGETERSRGPYEGMLGSVDEFAPRVRGWDVAGDTLGPSAAAVAGQIEAGTDAIVVLAHESCNERREPTLRWDDVALPLDVLHDALRRNPRPLRALVVIASHVHDPVTRLIVSLAEAGRLHPHFGGVLVQGALDPSAAARFTAVMLGMLSRLGEGALSVAAPERDLASASPLAFAVQRARAAVLADPTSQGLTQASLEAARPRLVHANPVCRPLPVSLALEKEAYLHRLVATRE